MLLRSTTVTLRWYYDATTKVLRLYKNLFVLRCTAIFLVMSKNIVVLSGVVTVHGPRIAAVDHEFRPDATAIFKNSKIVIDRTKIRVCGKGAFYVEFNSDEFN